MVGNSSINYLDMFDNQESFVHLGHYTQRHHLMALDSNSFEHASVRLVYDLDNGIRSIDSMSSSHHSL